MLNLEAAPAVLDHHDVEAQSPARPLQPSLAAERSGATPQSPPLRAVDGSRGSHPSARRAHSNLHKDEIQTFAREQIDLTTAGAPVAVEQFVAAKLKEDRSQLLGAAPAMGRRVR